MRALTKSTIALTAIAALALPGAATAKTIKMTVVGAPPTMVTPVKVTKEFFVPEVSRRLAASGKDFKIEWTQAYAQTLATFPEVFEAVEEGIGHVGVILRNFEPSKLPMEQYASSIPFGITDTYTMIKVDNKVRQQNPEMNKHYLKFNQVFLAGASSENMHLFTNFPVKTYDDLKGHKLGASGALGNYLKGTGAVIVSSAMSKSFLDIKNGVYDGYPIGEGLAFPYKTYEAAPYFLKTYFGTTNVPALTVNRDMWESLPSFVKTIFMDVAQEWAQAHAKMDRGRLKKFTGIMVKKGVKMTTLPQSERKRWANAMPNIAKEWAAGLDKKNLPGTKILKSYMNEVRASGIEVLRQWDR
ncbi:MAG: TRAP transporter substrate-binding protein DctP [Rhodospirillales bacterium]|nr:TRAP transporter substrate-binding protein DctP [Rhodospirillales bacterium]